MKVLLASLALLGLTGGAPAPAPVMQFVGGVNICARDAATLKAFYEKLGFVFSVATDQGYYGGFEWGQVDFHFGLTQRGKMDMWCTADFEATPTVGLSFRVSDLDAYVADVKTRGLEPMGEILDAPEGRFALYQDPEGNMLSLWGVAKR